MERKTIGILAFQGDVIEHRRMIERLGESSIEVRTVQDLEKIDALIIPGGESTTIGFFLETTGIGEILKKWAREGRPQAGSEQKLPFPIWGTCAGAIVLAKKIQSRIVPYHLGLMDMTVERNAYGRQIDSFYTSLEIPAIGIHGLKAAFIRAPIISSVDTSSDRSRPRPEILATHEGKIILVRQGNLLASTFHPELTNDTRLHEYFLKMS